MQYIQLILWSFLSYFLAGFLHELGHVAFGKAAGMKFCYIVIGPVGIRKGDDKKNHFYVERDRSLWLGVSCVLPRDLKNIDCEINRFATMLLGGPLFSIAIGICAIALTDIKKISFLFIFGAISIGIGVACLIPMRAGAFYTDGGRWIRLRRKNTRIIEKAILRSEWRSGKEENYSKVLDVDINVLIKSDEIESKYLGFCYMYKKNARIGNDENAQYAKRELDTLKTLIPKTMVKLNKIND